MSKIVFLDIFILKKKSILCQKISKISDFFLNLGQLQKMQKSAKGLISFFCKVYVSPLIGKKLAQAKPGIGRN